MFQFGFELPTEVRNSFDEKDQAKFMEVYNSHAPKDGDDAAVAMKAAWKACAELPSSFSFNAIASVDAIDSDREKVDVESIKKHMDEYIRYGGNINWEHRDMVVGTVWDWAPIDVKGKPGVQIWGNLFGGRDIYDQARKMFAKGQNGVSLGGQARRTGYTCDKEGCYVSRSVDNLYEISITANPANPFARTLDFSKGEFTKSKKGVDLSITQYTIHRDYGTCPIMKVKRELEAAGFAGLHATQDGVFMPASDDSSAYRYLVGQKGYVLEKSRGGFLVQDRTWATERAFTYGFSDGYLSEDGRVMPWVEESTFKDLYRKGLIMNDGEGYRIDPRFLDTDL